MTAPAWLEAFVADRGLPGRFLVDHLSPVAAWLIDAGARRIALSGGQGTGKSTIGACLAELFSREHGRRCALLSLDDFYLPRAERLALAGTVHRLYRTRGVPGTHDIDLLSRTLDELDGSEGRVAVPVFDKSRDDRAARPRFVRLPVDNVIVEGWCVGARHEAAPALERSINRLEREEDPDGRWRRDVNARLRRDYEPVFAGFDRLVFLRPPNYDSLFRWRAQQEHELVARRGSGMTDRELTRFMQHYERLTRACLEQLPARADVVVDLREDHTIAGVRFTRGGTRGS